MRFRGSLVSDGAYLLLILSCFICIVFTAGDPNRYLQNVIFLNVAFLIAIVTYFTNVTAGLILNILFIFGYGTYTLYQTIVQGDGIGVHTYFWLVMTPAFTLVTWLLTYGTKQLQQENERLRQSNTTLATMDERTSLKNTLSFQYDAPVFMALSVRYGIPLTLLVIGVKYWDEIKRMIGEQQLLDAVAQLSKLGQTSIRTNDSLYILNRDNPTWGILLFTDRDGANLVMERLKERVADLNRSEFAEKYRVGIVLRMGAFQYDPETVSNPLEFVAQAKRQLEYDV
ncbi:GGDEF domain-containing protein [Paenibacillus sp. HJGM_3]|uniref:GGDEF domain-containing protein n=1 Tax=Paenibacillus sp. HJGM_3 TaxID=3379816 RepID=UPI00385C9696